MFKFQDNKLIDFGYSLKMLVDKKKYVIHEQGFVNSDITDTIDWLEHQISVVTFRQMKEFVRKYMFQDLIVKYAMYHPEADEKYYIKYLKTMDEEAFMADYNKNVLDIDEGEASDDRVKECIRTINRNNLQKEAPSFTAYSYLRRNITELKEVFVNLLEEFLPTYLTAKKRIESINREAKNTFEARIHSFEDLLDMMHIGKADSFPNHNTCICYVTGFMYTAIYIHEVEKSQTMYVAIGTALTWILTDKYKESQELAFYKCFSDPTKLKMLKYIKDQQMCADDLAKEMHLSKSNISHHVSQLITAQVIQLSAKDGKKIYYSINTDQIEHMFNKTLEQFKN